MVSSRFASSRAHGDGEERSSECERRSIAETKTRVARGNRKATVKLPRRRQPPPSRPQSVERASRVFAFVDSAPGQLKPAPAHERGTLDSGSGPGVAVESPRGFNRAPTALRNCHPWHLDTCFQTGIADWPFSPPRPSPPQGPPPPVRGRFMATMYRCCRNCLRCRRCWRCSWCR